MWNLSKMLSALWGIFGFVALIVLFIIYANYPDYVSLDILGIDSIRQLNRQDFFLLFIGLYLLVNLIIFSGIRATDSFSKLNKLARQQQLRIAIAMKTMAVGGNLFLITLMIFMRSIIVSQTIPQSSSFIILLVGPLIIAFGLFFLLYVSMFPSRIGS